MVVTTLQWNTLLFQPDFDTLLYQIANFTKLGQLFIVRACKGCRVFEGPVRALVNARPDRRTIFISIVTDRDQILEQDFSEISIHAFGSLVRNIGLNFPHAWYGKFRQVTAEITNKLHLEENCPQL